MKTNSPLIQKNAVEPLMKNGYILSCSQTQHSIYIDPGDEAPHLLRYLDENGLELVAIVNTHAHMDHICGVGLVKDQWDVPIYLHPEDESLYNNLPTQAQWFGLDYPAAPPVERYLQEGQELASGELRVKIHHTPGHSPGSVCLTVGGHAFCGDVIFAGSIGRTDLPGGSFETLMSTIRHKILPLGDDTILHPGHGPDTTVGQERATNPFLTAP